MRDRHSVLVKDYNERKIGITVVERLVNHAAGISAVTNDADGMIFFFIYPARLRKAEGCGNCRRGVSCAERVLLALLNRGEAGKSAGYTKIVKARHSSGEYLMNVRLMSNVEYQGVFGDIKNSVNSEGKLNNTEIGGKVTAVALNLLNKKLAYFPRKR